MRPGLTPPSSLHASSAFALALLGGVAAYVVLVLGDVGGGGYDALRDVLFYNALLVAAALFCLARTGLSAGRGSSDARRARPVGVGDRRPLRACVCERRRGAFPVAGGRVLPPPIPWCMRAGAPVLQPARGHPHRSLGRREDRSAVNCRHRRGARLRRHRRDDGRRFLDGLDEHGIRDRRPRADRRRDLRSRHHRVAP